MDSKNQIQNREIKFRAWDINKKVFIPTDVWVVITNDFNALGVMLEDWEDYKEGEYFYSNAQIVEQFTGKHDDNDKEIYEGDIIIDINGNEYTVEWNNDTCKFQLSDGSDLNDGDRYGTYKCIIGNIHEHTQP